MDTKKKKIKLNLFDGIVILLILVIAVGAYFVLQRSNGENMNTTETTIFTIELTKVPDTLINSVAVGDTFKDNSSEKIYGTVVSYESVPYTALKTDQSTDMFYDKEEPGYVTLRITLETNSVTSDDQIKTSNGLTISTGGSVDVSNGKIYGTGYIIGIEREGEA